MKKFLFLAFAALLFCCSAQAQFKKLINKAKEKAVEAVIGTPTGDTASSAPEASPASEEAPATAETNASSPAAAPDVKHSEASNAPPPPPPSIAFPKTGVTVKATHAVIAPVIDGDVQKIVATAPGQYGISLAKQKGLTGTDVAIFKQLLDPANFQILNEIDSMVALKFPDPDDADDADETSPGSMGNTNPAWGGISAPSLYFDIMVGRFDIWMTDHYIKTTMKHDHFTMADAFGVNAVGITDIDKRMVYSIGSVLGVNFTSVKALDTTLMSKDYGASMVIPLIKKQYMGIKGVKEEPGAGGKFGEYNTVSEKIIIPVQPYVDPDSHYKSNSLLQLHDILANKEDAAANDGKGHYDPSYKIIYEYYFTHDFDKYLPAKLKTMETAAMQQKGMCVGAAIEDENGNRAIYRIIDVTTDQDIDKGAFQVPDDYPVMTNDELKKAIRKKMGANLLKGLVQPSGNSQE